MTSDTLHDTIENYSHFRNGIRTLMNSDPYRADMSMRVMDFCLWFNIEMQNKHTIAVQIPQFIRENIGRHGNYFYPKEILDYPF